jgi:hypothetical protein
LLKLDTLAGGVTEEEAEVNVHNVSLDIHEDVSVVPVLDLQNVADQGVGREGPTEVLLSLLEFYTD